jgi:hypothetical protein
MSSLHRSIPRAVRFPAALVVALTLVGGLLGACSSSGSSSAGDAAAAAAVVSSTFHVPADAQACLAQQLAANSKARDAMTSTKELSSSQRDAVAEVLETCVTVEQWAAAIAGRITAAVPPADTSKLTTQVNCLSSAVQALDDVQRRALLVGLVVIGSAPQTGGLAVQRGDVLNGLYAACSVVVGPSSTSSTQARG